MIIGLGIDLVEIARIERAFSRFGNRFLEKIFMSSELCHMPKNPAFWLAGRFAAKEATVKALGTGFRDGISMPDIEVVPDELGKPCIRLHNAAADRSMFLKVHRAHLSISHERSMAAAVVVLEK